jgi:hypothetical protein
MELKIDILSKLLPDQIIKQTNGKIQISPNEYSCSMYFPVSETIEEITDYVNTCSFGELLFEYSHGRVLWDRVLSKYHSIVNFKTNAIRHRLQLFYLLSEIIEKQKEKELLLEEVLRSKKNIGGLIENKIRSFIYYNIKLT